jgi:hypothetical protein
MKKEHNKNTDSIKFQTKVFVNSVVIPVLFYFTGYTNITLILMAINTIVYLILLPVLFRGRKEENEIADKTANFIIIFIFGYVPIVVGSLYAEYLLKI